VQRHPHSHALAASDRGAVAAPPRRCACLRLLRGRRKREKHEPGGSARLQDLRGTCERPAGSRRRGVAQALGQRILAAYASEPFGDFKGPLVGLLAATSYETAILAAAARLASADAFRTLAALLRQRTHPRAVVAADAGGAPDAGDGASPGQARCQWPSGMLLGTHCLQGRGLTFVLPEVEVERDKTANGSLLATMPTPSSCICSLAVVARQPCAGAGARRGGGRGAARGRRAARAAGAVGAAGGAGRDRGGQLCGHRARAGPEPGAGRGARARAAAAQLRRGAGSGARRARRRRRQPGAPRRRRPQLPAHARRGAALTGCLSDAHALRMRACAHACKR
jgi:hypothetical protein